jgi:hypothetical protein
MQEEEVQMRGALNVTHWLWFPIDLPIDRESRQATILAKEDG